jgi:undecaprenyl-diphosphatase
MPPHRRAFPLRHALVLGVLQGPTELLPVSSSAHTILIPQILRWPYAELDPALRKSFQVSLHAGAALALIRAAPRQLREGSPRLERRTLRSLALTSAPAAACGFLLEERIERALGGARQVAWALAAGALAMALADARAATRRVGDASVGDELAIGVAQAVALIPGVSRNGAVLAAARARRFRRRDAHTLSWRAAAPLMAGASALRIVRALRQRLPAGSAPALATGSGAAFCSTLACLRALRSRPFSDAPLAPYAVYRLALAALVAARLRRGAPPGTPAPETGAQ